MAVTALQPGKTFAWRRITGGERADIRLRPAVTLTGRVLHPDGSPIAGLSIGAGDPALSFSPGPGTRPEDFQWIRYARLLPEPLPRRRHGRASVMLVLLAKSGTERRA